MSAFRVRSSRLSQHHRLLKVVATNLTGIFPDSSSACYFRNEGSTRWKEQPPPTQFSSPLTAMAAQRRLKGVLTGREITLPCPANRKHLLNPIKVRLPNMQHKVPLNLIIADSTFLWAQNKLIAWNSGLNLGLSTDNSPKGNCHVELFSLPTDRDSSELCIV